MQTDLSYNQKRLKKKEIEREQFIKGYLIGRVVDAKENGELLKDIQLHQIYFKQEWLNDATLAWWRHKDNGLKSKNLNKYDNLPR